MTASQLGQQAQGTVERGTDKVWKVLPQTMTCAAEVNCSGHPDGRTLGFHTSVHTPVRFRIVLMLCPTVRPAAFACWNCEDCCACLSLRIAYALHTGDPDTHLAVNWHDGPVMLSLCEWQVAQSFLGGCVAAPISMLMYYYWKDPDMTKGAPASTRLMTNGVHVAAAHARGAHVVQ